MLDYKNSKKAFSMIELMIALSIMVVLSLVLAVSIGKKSATRLAESTGGEFICYKDDSGSLHQQITLKYLNSTNNTVETKVVDSCSIKFPANATDAQIWAIGGGGGGGGLFDITDTSSSLWTSSWTFQDSVTGSFKPISCSTASSLHCNASGYCAEFEYGGSTYKLKHSGSSTSITPYDSDALSAINTAMTHHSLVIATPATLTNQLSGVMTNNSYNTFVINDYKIEYKIGASSKNNPLKNFSAQVGTNYYCHPGVEEQTLLGNVKIKENDGYIINTSIPELSNITTNEKINYSYQLLDKVKLPYGTAGSPGQTKFVEGKNLSNQTLKISENHIGRGGKGGILSNSGNAGGQRGENTSITIGSDIIEANGGVGGYAVFEDFKPVPKTAINSTDTSYPTIPTGNYISTEYNDYSLVSDYVKDKILPGVVDPHLYSMKATTCDITKGKCEKPDRPTESDTADIGFGTGGGGINSMLLVNSIYKLGLSKTNVSSYAIFCKGKNYLNSISNTSDCNEVKNEPKLINGGSVGSVIGNDGVGGAVIIRWGTMKY